MSKLPGLVRVRQEFRAPKLEDVEAETAGQFYRAGIAERITPGSSVAIAVGSRGIANLPLVVRKIAQMAEREGGRPFIVPAMGSHGGATAEGQEEVLASYGITPESVGAPVRSSMEVVQLGTVEETVPVHFDSLAAEADMVIVVNRIKAHTNFKSDLESGLTKMMTVGLGNHAGAAVIHTHGVHGLKQLIPKMTEVILKTLPNIFGVALVENAYEQTARVVALAPEEIVSAEKQLLTEAKDLMARLPSDKVDILLVEEMGKNISGSGMDTNVIGRMYTRGQEEPEVPEVTWIGVLNLTPESHGNAVGIGYADLTTKRLVDSMDLHTVYTNAITAVVPSLAKIPMMLSSDRELVETAIKFMEPKAPDEIRLVRIRSTLELQIVEISEAIWSEIETDPKFEALGDVHELQFDKAGNIVPLSWSGAT